MCFSTVQIKQTPLFQFRGPTNDPGDDLLYVPHLQILGTRKVCCVGSRWKPSGVYLGRYSIWMWLVIVQVWSLRWRVNDIRILRFSVDVSNCRFKLQSSMSQVVPSLMCSFLRPNWWKLVFVVILLFPYEISNQWLNIRFSGEFTKLRLCNILSYLLSQLLSHIPCMSFCFPHPSNLPITPGRQRDAPWLFANRNDDVKIFGKTIWGCYMSSIIDSLYLWDL